MRKIALVVLSALCMVVSAQKRVALVIGNKNYSGDLLSLRTSVQDAVGMKNILTAMKYEVICDSNVNRKKMTELVQEFRDKAQGADIALVYYSGHGCMVNEKYYLVPSGMVNLRTIISEAYPFDDLTSNLKNCIAPVKVAFIDACRNETGTKGGGLPGGVLPINYEDVDSTKGVFACFYASAKGTKAYEGNGMYSVFTTRLIEYIHKPTNLWEVWNQVKDAVIDDNYEQSPEVTANKIENIGNITLNPDKVHISNPFFIAEGMALVKLNLFPLDAQISFGGTTYSNGQQLYFKLGKSYAYKVAAPGFETEEGTVVITSFNEKEYTVRLTKQEPATLAVTSNVDGARVLLDDKYVGLTPKYNIETLSGKHTIRVEKSGYNPIERTLKLSAGDNFEHLVLRKDYPWAWVWDKYECPKGNVSYHFSPQNQLGLSYDHIFENHLSIGGMVSTSFGVYRGWNFGVESVQISSVDVNINNGIATYVESIYGAQQDYSSFVDPHDEAKHYDANALFLVQGGYLPCHLVMLNLGLGAAYHRDKYYMEDTYIIKHYPDKGETVYTPTGNDHWYKQNTKWSPAIRLGAKFFIPIDKYQENCITIGGGYTYLPTTHKYSTWDASIGLSWQF